MTPKHTILFIIGMGLLVLCVMISYIGCETQADPAVKGSFIELRRDNFSSHTIKEIEDTKTGCTYLVNSQGGLLEPGCPEE